MAISRWLAMSAFSCWVLMVADCRAADLTTVARRIDKEPAYKSEHVEYALVVFGEHAVTRVWLAFDAETLYADVNGNGDLTEDGERFALVKEMSDPEEGLLTFNLPEIREGDRLHKNLVVSVSKLDHLRGDPLVDGFLQKNANARSYSLSAEVELPSWRGAGVEGRVRQHNFHLDARGVLQFADQPADAPILHFGGPWQVSLFGPHTLVVGRTKDLVLGVGTPGIGPGTTVWVDYEGVIPETAFPAATISYPAERAGDPPIDELYELRHRC